jgi:hypothetical protein
MKHLPPNCFNQNANACLKSFTIRHFFPQNIKILKINDKVARGFVNMAPDLFPQMARHKKYTFEFWDPSTNFSIIEISGSSSKYLANPIF